MQMLYAAYGSNLHPVRLKARVRAARLLGSGSIAGWELRFNKLGSDGSAKCNIANGRGRLYVAVYELDRAGMSALDAIEGVGFGYRRTRISVSGYGLCHTYIAKDSYVDGSVQPYSWYKQLVLAGCEAHGFPGRYIDIVRAVAAISDPDRERHAVNRAIVSEVTRSLNGGSI